MQEKLEKIANEYVISLFPVFMLVDGSYNFKNIGSSACYVAIKIQNNAVEYYDLPTNWEKVHFCFVERIKKDAKFLKNVFSKTEILGYKQVNYTERIKRNIKSKSNKLLNSYYQKYIKYNIELYSYSGILPLLDFQSTTFLSDEVNRILKEKNQKEYFEILTTPLKNTFNKLHEIDLLKILAKIKKGKTLYNKFKILDSKQLAVSLKKKYPKIWHLINNHTKKYCWVHYVYEGPAADSSYFIDIIKDFIKRRINPIREIKNYKQEKRELKLKQSKILNGINLSSYEKQIIELARDAVFYKPYRRELQTWSYYNMETVLKEIANRLFLSLKQVRMMLPNEIGKALLKNKFHVNSINERMSLVIYGRTKGKRFCFTGKQAREFIKNNIKKEKIIRNVSKILGTVAFKGMAKGKVKIINSPDEMIKMSDNDILISASTSPNLMPAIRKAKAIITNEGGLTCHAAIVSREFKIPCIIGTKIATKVLKDGDKVEVDANKGIVKKIK